MQRTPENAFVVVGRRIRIARESASLTQEDVAHVAGINTSYYGKLERGLTNPTIDTLIRIASVIGVDPGSVLEGVKAGQLPERKPAPRRGPRRTSAA